MSVVKVGKKFENKGKTGKTHGTFKTKAGAEKQKAAIFASGWHSDMQKIYRKNHGSK